MKKLLAATSFYLLSGIALALLMAAGFALAIDFSQFRYTVF
jgi:hypothetical protein